MTFCKILRCGMMWMFLAGTYSTLSAQSSPDRLPLLQSVNRYRPEGRIYLDSSPAQSAAFPHFDRC